jgi:hypothetical protein
MKINQAVVNDVTQRYINNLLALWELSSKHSSWYSDAHIAIKDIAKDYNVSAESVAYVVATLSPALSWNANVESTLAFFDSWFGGTGSSKRQTAYGTNVQKCVQYMFGERKGVPTGQKVSAFYSNLLGDYSVVTLDRHAIRAARWGMRNLGKESGEQKICEAEFAVVGNAYRYAAGCVGVSVAEFQATIWVLFAQKSN